METENTHMKSKQELNGRLLNIISDIKATTVSESLPYLLESLDYTKTELEHNEFKITVVGEFSSGKSTFLNALIGKDILPHGVKETTAAVTYIHNVSLADGRLNKAEIHFRDKSKKNLILDLSENRNALVDYVTTSENQYHVVQDIYSVDVYVHFLDIDDPIVLVDTPGMNGVADGHKDITLHEIRHSYASICLFHLRGIGRSDLEFLKELMKYQNTFFFVLNAIDDIKSNEETYEDRIQAFKGDIVEHVYDGEKSPEFVFGVSALKALCSRDQSIVRVYDTDETDLCEIDRMKLLEESKLPLFERTLFEFLRCSEKDREFYEVICHRLLHIIDAYKDAALTDKKIREAQKEDIPEKKRILELIADAEKKTQEFRNKLEITLKSMVEDLRAKQSGLVREAINREYDKQVRYINGLSLEEAIQESDSNGIGKKLNDFWASQVISTTEALNTALYRIQQDIVMDMQRVIPTVSFKEKKIHITTEVRFERLDDEHNSSHIARLKSQKEKCLSDIRKHQNAESSSELNRKKNALDSKINSLKSDKRIALSRLGSRPGVRYKTVSEEVKNNGFTNLWGLFGDRYKTETRQELDYSAQEAYDKDRRRIEQRYSNDIQSKRSEMQRLNERLEKVRQNENLCSIWETKVKEIEQEIQKEERFLEDLKMNARTSFLKNIKQELLSHLDKHLSSPEGHIYADLTVGIRENLQNSIGQILQALYAIFDEKRNEYVSNLQLMISRIEESNNVLENSHRIQILSTDIKVLDDSITAVEYISNGLQSTV